MSQSERDREKKHAASRCAVILHSPAITEKTYRRSKIEGNGNKEKVCSFDTSYVQLVSYFKKPINAFIKQVLLLQEFVK